MEATDLNEPIIQYVPAGVPLNDEAILEAIDTRRALCAEHGHDWTEQHLPARLCRRCAALWPPADHS